MSLQLERKPVDFHGQRYELTCNMAALEALEEEHGGSMTAVFEDSVDHVNAALFRIMLNDARAERGEEPVDRRQIAREYSYAMLRELDIFGMFLRAMSPEAAGNHNKEDPAKN